MYIRFVLALTVFLSLCSAPAAPRLPVISQHQLDVLVSHWQRVLALEDWEMRATVVRLNTMPDGALGYSQRNHELRFMSIWVLDPRDYPAVALRDKTVPKTGKEIIRDIEDTVIHELVHLRLRDLVNADEDGLADAEELTVNRITAALRRK